MERKDRDVKAPVPRSPSTERGPCWRAVGSAERGQRLNRLLKLLDSTSGACTAVGPCAMRPHTHTHTHTHTYSSAAEGCIRHVPRPKFRLVLLASLPRPFFRSVNVLLTPVFGGVRADVVLCGWWPLGETDSSAVVLG